MARYDIVDEGIIDADLSTVFKAYLDEFTGKTHWWMPLLKMKLQIVIKNGTMQLFMSRSLTVENVTRDSWLIIEKKN